MYVSYYQVMSITWPIHFRHITARISYILLSIMTTLKFFRTIIMAMESLYQYDAIDTFKKEISDMFTGNWIDFESILIKIQ